MSNLKKVIGISILLLFGVSQCIGQYNVYALDKLTAPERTQLAEYLPDGIAYRLGGEEYEHHTYTTKSIEAINGFVQDANGTISMVAGKDWENALTAFEALGASHEVTYGNEQYLLFPWSVIRSDFWTYLTNKEKFYRKQADKHVKEAKRFKAFMAKNGHKIRLIINVPLPQNKFLKAYLNQVAKHDIDKVSIHVYGKPEESNYLQKLEKWIAQITAYDWEVMAGEVSGVAVHLYPNLKNSLTMRDLHDGIYSLFNRYKITESYYFTLCYNEKMSKWQNAPTYPRYYVTGNGVIDELNMIFD